MTLSHTTSASAGLSPRQTRRRAVVAAAIGNFITWFDFAAYGFLAVTLGRVFFPSDNPTLSLLSTFAVFGVAFLMEPVGAFFFGRLGDRIGRKAVLVAVILLMSFATFVVGLLPGYGVIGAAAPMLLLVMRLLQGFAAGGEPGGAATFLLEFAEPDKRARSVSKWHASSYLANAAASVLILGLNATLSDASMEAWGWRIPFLVAAPIGLVGLFVRLKLSDTPEFERLKASGAVSEHPVREVLTTSRRQILQVVGCGALQYAAFYFTNIYMETYITSELGHSSVSAAVSTIVCLAVASVAIFVFARISDRVGRRPVLRVATIASVVLPLPVFLLMNSGSMAAVVTGHTLLGVCLAMFMAASGAALVEIFPSRVRYAGFSIGFNIAGALFGGTAPYLATSLIAMTGSPISPAFILVGTAVIALTAISTMQETAGPRATFDPLKASDA
jgi:MHS family proline/betaine transporter-like MFS transporter